MATVFEALIEWDGLRPHLLSRNKDNGHPTVRAADLGNNLQMAELHWQLHAKQPRHRLPAPAHGHGGPLVSVEIDERHFVTQPLGVFEGTYLNQTQLDADELRKLADGRRRAASRASNKTAGRKPPPRRTGVTVPTRRGVRKAG